MSSLYWEINAHKARELEGFIKAVSAYFISPLKLPVTLSQDSLKEAPGHTKNLNFCSKIFSAQERDKTFMDLFLTQEDAATLLKIYAVLIPIPLLWL